jgi:hypothetical protein
MVLFGPTEHVIQRPSQLPQLLVSAVQPVPSETQLGSFAVRNAWLNGQPSGAVHCGRQAGSLANTGERATRRRVAMVRWMGGRPRPRGPCRFVGSNGRIHRQGGYLRVGTGTQCEAVIVATTSNSYVSTKAHDCDEYGSSGNISANNDRLCRSESFVAALGRNRRFAPHMQEIH